MVTNTDLDIGSVCPVSVRGLNLTGFSTWTTVDDTSEARTTYAGTYSDG